MGWGEERVWIGSTIGELKACRMKPLEKTVDPKIGVLSGVCDWCKYVRDARVAGKADVTVE